MGPFWFTFLLFRSYLIQYDLEVAIHSSSEKYRVSRVHLIALNFMDTGGMAANPFEEYPNLAE
jgi:hypothetical protein